MSGRIIMDLHGPDLEFRKQKSGFPADAPGGKKVSRIIARLDGGRARKLCFVYCIGPHCGGPVKIGFTSLSTKSRLSGAQIGNWQELSILWDAHVRGVYQASFIENEIHKALWTHRIRGEWFDVGGQVARDSFVAIATGLGVPYKFSTDDGVLPWA